MVEEKYKVVNDDFDFNKFIKSHSKLRNIRNFKRFVSNKVYRDKTFK